MTHRAWLLSLLLLGLTSMPLSVAHAGGLDAGIDASFDVGVDAPRDAGREDTPDSPAEDAGVEDTAPPIVGEDGAISMDGGVVDEDAPGEETDTGTPGTDSGVGHDSGPIVPVPPSDGCSCRASSATAPSGLMIGGLALGLALASRRRH